MNRILSTLLAALAALAALCQPAAAQRAAGAAAPPHRFLHISDLHLDPFANNASLAALIAAPIGKWDGILAPAAGAGYPAKRGHGYMDSNYALVSAALEAAAADGPYDYVIFTGDYLAHDFETLFQQAGGKMKDYAAFTAKTVAYVNMKLRRTFPRTPILAALGNNDSDCGDYRLRPGSPLLTAMGATLPLVARNPAALRSLAATGSYVVPHPTIAGRDVIVLDDVPAVPESSKQWAEQSWAQSTNDFPCATPAPATPIDPMGWLGAALAQARAAGHGVTLVMHIPPGVDNYAASQQGCPNGSPLLLDTRANDALVGLLRSYADVIRDVYAGHTHMDDFRVLLDAGGAGQIPIRIEPSVSPYFGNTPAFTAFDYDPATGNATDYSAYAILPATAGPAASSWPLEYRFTAAYQLSDWGAASLGTLAGAIRSDAAARATFGNFYESNPALDPLTATGANWLAYSCAETGLVPADYSACTCPGAATPPAVAAPAGGG